MTQAERILEYLQSGRTLTRLNSWDELGVIEAPARISELRAKGHIIETEMKTVINRYGDAVKVAQWRLHDTENSDATTPGESGRMGRMEAVQEDREAQTHRTHGREQADENAQPVRPGDAAGDHRRFNHEQLAGTVPAQGQY